VLLLSPELAEQASNDANVTAPKMTEGFMSDLFKRRARGGRAKADPGCLSSRDCVRDDKQPGTRLAFTGFACVGENGLENHRTPASPPVGRVSAEQGACVRLAI
jgi:hypothetical protein